MSRKAKITRKTKETNIIVEVNSIYSKLLESEIIKYPNQYFWFHKKWDKNIYKQ